MQRYDFCSFTLSVNLIGLIFILKWFSAASGAVWGLTVSPFVEAVHWNEAFSVSTNCFLSHYPAPGYHYRPALAFVFLQLKNDLFSSDNDTTSSWRFTYSRLRLIVWNIHLFWHTSVWNESKNKLFNWRYWFPCLQRRTELPWQRSLNAPVRAIWPWPWATNVVQSRSFHWLNQKLSLPSLKRVVKSVISSLPLWIKHDCVHHWGLKEWFRHHKEFMSNNKNCILCGWMLKRERSSTKVSLPLWYVFNLSLHQICLVAYHISHGLFAQLNEIIDSIFLSSSMGNFYI